MPKPYDIIVFGATSFVGKILCRYLLTEYSGKPGGPNWAIAARSSEKLTSLIKELGDEGLDATGLKTIVADSSDEKSLKAMCKQTAVLVSTVGPYALYGETLVKVCAELGTDYCDLTGETPWVAQMITKYEATAQASGARIVHCCGFDSIPSDMGVWFLQTQAKKQFDAPCPNVTMRVKKMKGTASGGTIASILNIMKEASANSELRKLLANPYAMCPPNFAPKAKQYNQLLAAYDKNFDVWTAPFIMAGVNTRVVFRSNALLMSAYSAANTPFTYNEAMMMGSGTLGRIKAMQFSAGLGGFALAAAIPPSRWALEKFLPKPGEGPNRQAQLNGFFDLRFHGVTTSGQEIKIKVTGDQDPGYGSTGKMLGQAAMCLAFDMPKGKKPGGFWTPASLFGNLLIKRLQKQAGLTFEVI
jgi:short subunit dehydrogenase-like uncharacterized protein